MKIMKMIGIQHISDRNTTVPDWFVTFYDSGYFWVAIVVLMVVAAGLIVVACRLYYQIQEVERILEERKEK